MCGRFTLRSSAKAIAEQFQLVLSLELTPRYNIAPTQSVAAVRSADDPPQRELVMLHWGLIPFWAGDRKIASRTINARAETVATKPSFRQAFQKRRCLIIADGYYEWQKIGDKKQPFYIHRRDNQPFAFAGLWERWHGDGAPLQSCTIIVTAAAETLRPIHDRMPVILHRDDYDRWLDPESRGSDELNSLLGRSDTEPLQADRVSTLVNSPKNDLPQCIEPTQS